MITPSTPDALQRRDAGRVVHGPHVDLSAGPVHRLHQPAAGQDLVGHDRLAAAGPDAGRGLTGQARTHHPGHGIRGDGEGGTHPIALDARYRPAPSQAGASSPRRSRLSGNIVDTSERCASSRSRRPSTTWRS